MPIAHLRPLVDSIQHVADRCTSFFPESLLQDPSALIVTLQMEAAAAARFTAQREAYFPAARNWLSAHVTLFHALPVESLPDVLADVAELAESTPTFQMQVERVVFLGRGVAYALGSPEGVQLRRTLAGRWDGLLGRQDRAWQGRLHVTVQNKVEPSTARALHAKLAREFVAENVDAVGLSVWYYVGGPWEHAATSSFRQP